MTTFDAYQAKTKLDKNAWITDPRVPDPENLPEPLGWTILVRPYPVTTNKAKTSLIILDEEVDFMSNLTNIGRVVSIGPCCWNRPHHKDKDGNKFDWVSVGDFVTYPRNVGARRKFKDVSFVLLCDEEIVERLVDPQVFNDSVFKVDIPDEELQTYLDNQKDKQQQ